MKAYYIQRILVGLMALLLLLSMIGCQSPPEGQEDGTKDPSATDDPLEQTPSDIWNHEWELEFDMIFNDKDTLYELNDFSWENQGILTHARELVGSRDIKNAALWATFVDQFRTQPDGDGGWRGEFWGKMMRGACLTYRSTGDEELYNILTESVRDLLTTQEENGRISSYPADNEFHGWDMWCRKYVMLGLEYYLDICRDDALYDDIIDALCAHADYIIEFVGSEDGQIELLDTSNQWGGTNSASILEPMVWLYTLTEESDYLDFATYILESGGSKNHNIFQMALEGTLYPYQYGVGKAYEMTSCFEGVLAYYRVTGEERYRQMALNYYHRMLESDVTLIGCCGSEGELLNHATVEQSNPAWIGIMQETCVTVTWMKFCYQVLRLTGDSTVADALEYSAYNAMLGSVIDRKGAAPFDSYSPLLMGARGQGRGGAQSFSSGGSYGCCEAIGAAGTAISAMAGTMRDADGIVCNLYESGIVKTATPTGNPLILKTETEYPVKESIRMTVSLNQPEAFAIKLRIPAWSKQGSLRVNEEEIALTPGTYATLNRTWNEGDVIELTLDLSARVLRASDENGDDVTAAHVAVVRGPIVLARDARLGEPLLQAISLKDDTVELTPSQTADFPTNMEFSLTDDSGRVLHLIDYASAGKTCSEASLTSIWHPTKEYWRDASFEGFVMLSNVGTGKAITADTTGRLIKGPKTNTISNDDAYVVEMELLSNGFYTIRLCAVDRYLTVNNVGKVTLELYSGNKEQQFRICLDKDGKMSIISKRNGNLLCEAGDSLDVHTYSRVNSPVQYWYATTATYDGGTLDVSQKKEVGIACDVPMVASCVATGKLTKIDTQSGRLIKGPFKTTTKDLSPYIWVIEDAGNGQARIRLADGTYLSGKNGTNKLFAVEKANDKLQLFEFQKKDNGAYIVANVATGMLLSESGEDNTVHLYSDCSVDAQVWWIKEIQ